KHGVNAHEGFKHWQNNAKEALYSGAINSKERIVEDLNFFGRYIPCCKLFGILQANGKHISEHRLDLVEPYHLGHESSNQGGILLFFVQLYNFFDLPFCQRPAGNRKSKKL